MQKSKNVTSIFQLFFEYLLIKVCLKGERNSGKGLRVQSLVHSAKSIERYYRWRKFFVIRGKLSML